MPFMWALWLCRSAQTSAAVLLAGTATLRLLAWGTGVERSAGWNPLFWTSWGVLLSAAVLSLGLTAADMSGLPLGQACSGQVLGSVLASTTFGAVWKLRVSLLAVALVIAAARREVGRTQGHAFLDVAGAALAAALLATLIWSGHAQSSDRRGWLLPADLAHVLAAGAWPGGLLPLAWLLRRAGRDPVLVPAAIAITRRYSRVSVIAVGLLAGSGLLNSYGLVRTFSALWSTPYGRLILCKTALFAGMVCLGAVNRRVVLPASAVDPAGTVRRLWRQVGWECLLATAVILATEALAMHAPPAGG